MRKYTGYTGRKSTGEGIERLVALCRRRWAANCLGTFSDRDKRGKPGQKSIHADYRAADLRFPARRVTVEACDWFTNPIVADRLGVELVCDYAYRGPLRRAYGRIWVCNTGVWRNLKKGDVVGGGASWADYIHIEIAPGRVADSGDLFERAWRSLPRPKEM